MDFMENARNLFVVTDILKEYNDKLTGGVTLSGEANCSSAAENLTRGKEG